MVAIYFSASVYEALYKHQLTKALALDLKALHLCVNFPNVIIYSTKSLKSNWTQFYFENMWSCLQQGLKKKKKTSFR